MRISIVLASVLLALPICSQTTYVINSFDGVRITAALARPGDTLIVRPGQYEAPIIRVGLKILCDPGVQLGHHFGSHVRIENVPVGQHLIIRGASMITGHAPSSLVIQNCGGSIIFEDCSNSRTLYILNAAQVSFNDCSLSGVSVRSSTVAISGGKVLGSNSTSAVSSSASDVVIHNTELSTLNFFTPELSTVRFNGGTVKIAGDSTVLTSNATRTAVITATSGKLHIDPAVQFRSSAAAISGGAAIIRERIPSVRAVGTASGQVFHGVTHAPARDYSFTFASWPTPAIVTPLGVLWIDPSSPVVDSGSMPASELRSFSTLVPALPARGLPVVLQPISVSPAGLIRFGLPATIVLN